MRDGWVETTLGAVAALRGSKADPSSLDPAHPYVGLEHLETGYPRVRAWGQAGEMSSLVSIFEEGDTLFGRLRPYLRKVALAEFAGVCTSEILVLTPDRGAVLPAFLHLLASAESTIDMCVARSAGSRMPRTSAADLLAFPIALPPLAEQRRIVDLIEVVDEGVAGASLLQDQLGRVLSGLRDDVSALATGAPTVALGTIAEVVGGITKDKNKQFDHYVEVPYLRVANVQRAHLDLTEMVTIRASTEKVSQLKLRHGDILFNEGGDRDKLGRGWVWEGQIEDCIHQNHVFRARLTSPDFDPYFAAMCANNSAARTWFESMGSQTTNLASINLRSLKAFPVPVLPMASQRQVVETYLAVMEALDSALLELAAMRRLRSTLLTDLLSGDHEIPESYDELLESVA